MTEWIISSSILIVTMLLLRTVLRGKVTPRIQYALWAIVLLRLLMPFSLFQSTLSVQNIHEEVRERPAVQQVYQAMSTPIVPNPGRQPAVQLPAVPQSPQTNAPNSLPQQQPDSVPDAAPDAVELQVSHTVSMGDVLVLVWVAGILAMTGWMAGCNIRFSRRLKRSRKELDVPDSLIPVYQTRAVETPCLFGLFDPAVYLTPEVAENDTLRNYVLTHELTHYRQFDHVWATLRATALVLHWYNPLVWMAFRASRQDGEMACDEGTLRQLGEEHRGNYGRTLIGLATGTRFRASMVTATSMGGTKRAMKERIVILMKNPKTAMMTMVSLILVCTLIVGCTFTGAVEKPTEPEETIPVETTEPTETTVPPTEDPEIELLNRYNHLLHEDVWLNQAMNCLFSSPEELDLEYYFHNGIEILRGDGISDLPAYEKSFLHEHELYTPIIMPEAEMRNILRSTFGIAPEDVRSGIPESWLFYEQSHKYYAQNPYLDSMADFTITAVEEQNDGMVQVYYIPVDAHFYLNAEPMLLTLRRTEKGDYQAVSNQLLDTDRDYTVLTPDQIAQVNVAFASTRFWQEGELSMGGSTAINGFFQSYYQSVAEMDLKEFLRNFSAYGIVDDWNSNVTEEEFSHICKLDGFRFPGVTSLEQMHVPTHKYPSYVVDAVIHHFSGVHLDELEDACGRSDAFYSEKYDAYYNHTSDFGPGTFTCIGGQIHDGYVELYSQENTVLILVEKDGKYLIESHFPLSWMNPVELTAYEIDQVNKAFSSTMKMETIYGTSVEAAPIASFFTSYYEDPSQIDLREFLRHFSAEGIVEDWYSNVSEEEFDYIRTLDGFLFPEVTSLQDMPVPTHKYPAEIVDAVIFHYTGLNHDGLDDANGKGDAFYCAKYDAYYNHTSDFGPGYFHCVSGVNYGSVVELYSENSVLVLQQGNDGRYYIHSHLPLEHHQDHEGGNHHD